MATQLTFAEEYCYPDDPSGITIPVLLTYGQRTVAATAKVDTGGGVCLFSHEIGLKLGIPIEQGIPTVLDSLGGPVEAFGHEVTFQTCSLVFRNLVYFAKLIAASVSAQAQTRQIPPAALPSDDEVKQWWEQVRAAGAEAAKAFGNKIDRD